MKHAQRLLSGVLSCALLLSLATPAHAGRSDSGLPSPVITLADDPGLVGFVTPPDRDVEYVPGEVIVKFKSGVSGAAASTVHERAGGKRKEAFRVVRGLELATIASGRTVPAAIKAYEAMPEVEYAQPNYLKRVAATPNDPLFGQQWGLHNTGQTGGVSDADIDAPAAWDSVTDAGDVIVAVLDTGIDYQHPDLAANIWMNPGEIPNNGLDDDGNGTVDDIRGWDALNIDADPMDDNGHGTHVAGILGALGNNELGVAGTAWNVSLMPVKMLGANGTGNTAGVLRAFEYVRGSDADVVSCSWGGSYAADLAEKDAIQAVDKLFVFAAGNEAENNDTTTPYYPASYDLPNILAVGASTASDSVASFSNFGATTVDVFAPGDQILSTVLPPLVTEVAADATVNPMFSDEFGTLTNWGQWAFGTYPYQPIWALNTSFYTSAPRSVAVVGYVDSQMVELRKTTAIDLSASDHPAMRFSYRCDLEPGYDYIVWGIYDDSAAKNTVLGYATGDTGGEFKTVVVDLQQFAGQPDAKPFFRLIADADVSSSSGYDGVWVDDVSVFDVDPGLSGSALVVTKDYPNAYGFKNGTSMATPYVTGIAALLLSRNPSLTVAQLKNAIMTSAEPKTALTGKCVTGARVNARAAIEYANRAPVAVDDSYDSQANTVLSVPAPGVLGNDSDSDGDSLSASKISNPAHGTVTLSADGSFIFTPDTDWQGTDTFTYRVSDGIGTSNLATVTITGDSVNHAPVAANDSYATQENAALAVSAPGVLSNDSDPDGDSLSAVLVTGPAHGSISLLGSGAFTYTPAPGYSGLDSFTYRASDGAATSNLATVTLNVLSRTRVYRFYNMQSGSHFYTASAEERDMVTARWPHIYLYEGVAYTLNPATNSLPLHRFYNNSNGTHFYTSSAEEANTVLARWPHIFTYDGVVYNVSAVATTVPVHRFYNLQNGSHFYTASAEERDTVMARWPHVYDYEGVGFFLGQ